jgi:hypothetical protein
MESVGVVPPSLKRLGNAHNILRTIAKSAKIGGPHLRFGE